MDFGKAKRSKCFKNEFHDKKSDCCPKDGINQSKDQYRRLYLSLVITYRDMSLFLRLQAALHNEMYITSRSNDDRSRYKLKNEEELCIYKTSKITWALRCGDFQGPVNAWEIFQEKLAKTTSKSESF